MTSRTIRKALIEKGHSNIAFVKECGQYLIIKQGKIIATGLRNLNQGSLDWYIDRIVNYY